MQGQGMENVGDKTFYWYSLWRTWGRCRVRLATWDHGNHFGMLKAYYVDSRASLLPQYGPEAITCPVPGDPRTGVQAFLNASGLGPHSNLRINLLDASFQPVPGYTATLSQNGLRLPIEMGQPSGDRVRARRVHVQIKFEGIRPEDANLYALYLVPTPDVHR